VSTNSSDVTDHSQWRINSKLITMAPGVIQVSWLLTIHDDADVEGDEVTAVAKTVTQP
jgi:hypothetical protein